jgi:Fur family transcriptional regulator, peroxide stress response regulator
MILNKKRRKSRQRERIYSIIAETRSHPTVQAIYDVLKREIRALSLGNVYRNIGILTGEGRIATRDFGDGIAHYDAVTKDHYHFICNKCGKVSDFDMPIHPGITSAAQKISKHTITGHAVHFFGVCESCGKSKKKIR